MMCAKRTMRCHNPRATGLDSIVRRVETFVPAETFRLPQGALARNLPIFDQKFLSRRRTR